ncbi:MAG: response regulator [Chitinivibrionales bacterium]|nr:response regulator [Chitinivibrionales bacterium]MBD3395679.1 response regulator [Chitinivibrionales bacterium]
MGGQHHILCTGAVSLSAGGAVSEKKRILLVDDNHDILDLLEMYLYRDYAIATALNGFEGLQKAREQLPDCIVTDIMMPIMDGIKFFNQLRRSRDAAHVPVIGITSFVRSVSITSLKNMGFFQVLTKPLKREDVVATVREALGSRQGQVDA